MSQNGAIQLGENRGSNTYCIFPFLHFFTRQQMTTATAAKAKTAPATPPAMLKWRLDSETIKAIHATPLTQNFT